MGMFDEFLPYSVPRADKVNPDLMDRFTELAQDYQTQTGEPLRVTDSFRTNEEQKDLKRRKPFLAAAPGKSNHEFGNALDVDQNQISNYGVDNWKGLVEKHGFVLPVLSKGETWHIELPKFEKAAKVAATVGTGMFDEFLSPQGQPQGAPQTGSQSPPQAPQQGTGMFNEFQDPRQPGGFLAPKIASAPVPIQEMMGADRESMKQAVLNPPNMGANPTVVNTLDLPSKYLLRKPLEAIHSKFIEPQRERTVQEWADASQSGANQITPEAFAALPTKETFVTPLEVALQPGLFGGLGSLAKKGAALPQKLAEEMYASAIKIPPKTPNWLRKDVIKTGMNEGYNVSQKGLDTLYNEIGSLNDQIAGKIGEGTSANLGISGEDVAKRLTDLRNYYADSLPNVREEAYKILDNLESQMVKEGTIPIAQAQRMKQQTYKDIKTAYAPNAGMKGPEIEGMKYLARGLKEEIAAKVPGIAPLNASESKLLDLAKFLDPAVNRTSNYDLIRMGDAIGTVMGGALGGPHGAAAGLAARRMVDTPAVKAKMAIWLNNMGKNPFGTDLLNSVRMAAPFMAVDDSLNRR